METKQIDCRSCGASIVFTILDEGDQHKQALDPEWWYYCPICSSAEQAKDVVQE